MYIVFATVYKLSEKYFTVYLMFNQLNVFACKVDINDLALYLYWIVGKAAKVSFNVKSLYGIFQCFLPVVEASVLCIHSVSHEYRLDIDSLKL